MKTLLLLLSISAALAQDQPPAVQNAQLSVDAFSGDLASALQASQPTWFGYAVKTERSDGDSCCFDGQSAPGCLLEGTSSRQINRPSHTPVPLEGSDRVVLLFRVSVGQVEKIRLFSLSCPLDAGGLPFVWLTGVPAESSLSYLAKLVEADSVRHLADGALFAITEHAGPLAAQTLIHFAKYDASPHVRSQALFWLSQKAGQHAAATIKDAIDHDPDTGVKRQAVFALSQLPQNEAIPQLIQVARSQRNPEVRKQAFFWLGQSHDPRALAFFEQILEK